MNSNPLLDPAYSPEYGPDSLERVNTLPGHDLGAHEDIDPAQVAERMRAHMHDSVLREDYTSPRVHRDKAMRVREERPTSFLTGQAVVASTVPVQIAYARRERVRLTVVNTGTNTVYVGSTQATAQPGSGYPLLPNTQIVLQTLSDLWASANTGSNVVGILDEFHAESDGV